MIKRSLIFNHLFSLIILFPVIFSFVFRMIGLPLPSYLFIIIISLSAIPLIANNLLTVSTSWRKLAFYILFAWILASISYTPSIIASKEKFVIIIYNTLLPILIVELFFLFSKDKIVDLLALESTLLKYAFVLLWFILVAYILFRKIDGTRYTIPGVDNAIWFSRYVGMLLLIILCCAKIRMNNLLLYIVSILIALVLLFGGGSRGPVLSVIIVFFIKQSYLISRRQLFLLLAGIACTIVIGFVFIGGYMFETNFYSLYARLDLFKLFLDFDFDFLKGAGIGSYSLSVFGEDVMYYPHNVFLELFFENGLIGVFLFCLVLFLFLRSFKPNIINLLCIYFFLASLVSGDIPGNNNLFILLFISVYANKNTLSKDDDRTNKNEIALKNG